MTNYARRLARLEAHSREIAVIQNMELPLVCFVDRDRKVISTLRWIKDEQVWTEFENESQMEDFGDRN